METRAKRKTVFKSPTTQFKAHPNVALQTGGLPIMSIKLKTVGVSVVVGAMIGGLPFIKPKATAAPTQIYPLSPAQISYDQNFETWLNDLAKQESGNRADIVVLDVNGRFSYGCLQFQRATFDSFSRRYELGTSDIFDCTFQRKLARLMIEDDYSAWKNWYNSVTRYGVGYPPKR